MHSQERSQETLALLMILAIAEKQVAEGQTYLLEEVTADLRNRRSGHGADAQVAP